MSSWRISRSRDAPRAPRTANSAWRSTPRASSRFVTFTHAIVSSRTTAPRMAKSAGLTVLVRSSCSVSVMKPRSEACPGRPGELCQRRTGDRVELLSRLIQRHVTRHPAHHAQVMAPFAAIEGEGSVVLQGRPDLRRGTQDILELAGHDADHGDRIVLDQNLTADDRGVTAKAPPPQPVADDARRKELFGRSSDSWKSRPSAGGTPSTRK